MASRSFTSTASQSNSSSINSRSLPTDIEAEILLHLPVKTLKRFMCSCKSWYSLISSPRFQNDHFHRAQLNPPLLLTIKQGDAKHLFESRFTDGTFVNKFTKKLAPRPAFLAQSCLGLVCISSFVDGPIYICNPFTQELISLPPTKGQTYAVGFGYSAYTKEFKVIRCSNYSWEGFTLGTSEWRDLRINVKPDSYRGRKPFFHGNLYFLSDVTPFELDDDYAVVLDVESEEWKRMRLPEKYYTEMRPLEPYRNLRDLGGSLCLCFLFWDGEAPIEVWLLKDYENGVWEKEYTIHPSALNCGRSDWYSFHVDPLAIMGDGSILMHNRTKTKLELLCYDPKDKVVTRKIDKDCSAALYVETFFHLGSKQRYGTGSMG